MRLVERVRKLESALRMSGEGSWMCVEKLFSFGEKSKKHSISTRWVTNAMVRAQRMISERRQALRVTRAVNNG